MKYSHTQTVVRMRSGGTDSFGDPLPGDELPIAGCVVRQRGGLASRENNNAASTVTAYRTLTAPPGSDIGPHDQVRIDAEVWDVDGDPLERKSPFSGWTPSLEVELLRVTG